jgi:hypothetical protein
MQRYEFEFAPQFRRFLLGFGVRPARAGVTLDGGWVIARFGPWVVETPVTNIKEVTVTGPYRWWRVIGTRLSLRDRGLTFGTNTRRGVCLTFRDPVAGVDPRGLIKHPGLTVTVADPDAVAAAIRLSAGIVG